MRPYAHRASVVVSALLGAGLLWIALRPPVVPEDPRPAVREEQSESAAVPPELPQATLSAEVVLPPPPEPKAAPKPKARSLPNQVAAPARTPEPEPPPAPAPAPEPVVEPAPPAPAEAPAAPEPPPAAPEVTEQAGPPPPVEKPAPLTPLKPSAPPRPERPAPAPIEVRPLQPSVVAEAKEPDSRVTPLQPAPPREEARPEPPPPEAPVVALRPSAPAERQAPPPALARASAPPERAAPAPEPAVGPTVEVSLRPDTPVVRDGRVLLLILEHGAGPGIEIVWPEDRAQRERLYRTLSACYGMRTALIDGGGRLYVGDGARGQAWVPSMDRYSGFMRQPHGALSAQEQREASAISQYHGIAQSMKVVRIFPRAVDAALLGGLRTLIGDRYGASRSITADYRSTSSGLFVDNIRVDGAAVAGRIAFPAVRSGCA